MAGCGGPVSGDSGGEGETITVLAASSLTNAFGELEEEFEDHNPGVEVRVSYGSSSALLAQLEQGFPADVYASADPEKMESARDGGLISGPPESFAGNREVVLVPESNPAGMRDFEDLSEPGTRLVLAQDGVPAAEYTQEILSRAADDEEYGLEFEEAVLGNVVSRESDVRAGVNRVVVGDADATFAYASDVTPSVRDEVEVVEIPGRLNVEAEYPIAVTRGTGNEKLARRWVELVTSDRGRETLARWGFEPPG